MADSQTQICTTVPAVEAVEGAPAYVKKVPVYAWNAGANSTAELDGDVELVFTQEPAVGVVIGFTQDRISVTSRSRVTHGFYFHYDNAGAAPVCQIIEGGRTLTAQLPHSRDTEWKVQRIGSTVRYIADDVVVLTSASPSVGTLSVGCALYATGDTVAS